MAVITHITPNQKPEAVGTVAHCKTAFAWAPWHWLGNFAISVAACSQCTSIQLTTFQLQTIISYDSAVKSVCKSNSQHFPTFKELSEDVLGFHFIEGPCDGQRHFLFGPADSGQHNWDPAFCNITSGGFHAAIKRIDKLVPQLSWTRMVKQVKQHIYTYIFYINIYTSNYCFRYESVLHHPLNP